MAEALVDGRILRGVSNTVLPVPGGAVDVGDIFVSEFKDNLYPGPQFRAGGGTIFAAVADLNGDGILDLAVANGESSDLSVLLGNGNGTFQPQQRLTMGFGSFSVAVADVDADGVPDIITALGSSNLSVLLGNGDGTFQAQQLFAVGEQPWSVVVIDLNRDGKPDLVTAGFSSEVSVLLHR